MAERKANKSGKYRVSVPLSETNFKRVLDDAEQMGVSPSTYINLIVTQHYRSLDTSKETIQKSFNESLSKFFDSMGVNQADGEKIVNDSLNESVENFKKLIVGKK